MRLKLLDVIPSSTKDYWDESDQVSLQTYPCSCFHCTTPNLQQIPSRTHSEVEFVESKVLFTRRVAEGEIHRYSSYFRVIYLLF